MAFFPRTTWVSQHQKDKTILNFNEARDDGLAVASAGQYANHLHHASTSSLSALPGCPTNSEL